VTISGATQRIFQAGKAMHDALTARRAVQPSTHCIVAGCRGFLFQFLREEKPPYHSSPKGEER
jgi:hypothetical protein